MARRKKLPWDASKSALQNARPVLAALAADYLRASQRITGRNPKALHKFRLKTKQFRYTLDLFRPCYGPGLRLRLDALRSVQRQLGEINDSVTTRRLLDGKRDAGPDELARVTKFLKARTSDQTRDLARRLAETLRTSDQQRWWIDYLARSGRSSRPKPARRK